MDTIVIQGGQPLRGQVKVEGAKNAVLPIIAGAILSQEGTITLDNTPILADVFNMKKVLNHLNVSTYFDTENNQLKIKSSETVYSDTPYEFMIKMRASVIVMGPLLARNGYAKIAMPGGCAIGSRPIDLHLKGFEAMGVDIEVTNGYIIAQADELKAADIYLDFPSVGATENIMMAATMAKGTTIIENVAREPEIVDLANFLNKMGADIKGAGTETLKIKGVERLTAAQHAIIPDRIESGTFAVAAAATQGDVTIDGFIIDHNKPLVSKLREMGVKITEVDNGIHVQGPKKLKATNVETLPYPGFPTDMQSQMTVLQALAEGTSIMKETVFENRFMHLKELERMGIEYTVDGNSAIINGGSQMQGAQVTSTDLRASAALVIAG
ncbi:MAG: UDP-N-acetylglucosamine 1-carboxyvinyltransferase, partial [Atopococcus tabaci]|nr:UDP-N-acetylglucosamine 1-carboxyvinyltransferase [Atopococcus tabaci]